MFTNSLDGILKSFDKVSSRLTAHVEKKSADYLYLLADRDDIEIAILSTTVEIERANRVLAKVKELTA